MSNSAPAPARNHQKTSLDQVELSDELRQAVRHGVAEEYVGTPGL